MAGEWGAQCRSTRFLCKHKARTHSLYAMASHPTHPKEDSSQFLEFTAVHLVGDRWVARLARWDLVHAFPCVHFLRPIICPDPIHRPPVWLGGSVSPCLLLEGPKPGPENCQELLVVGWEPSYSRQLHTCPGQGQVGPSGRGEAMGAKDIIWELVPTWALVTLSPCQPRFF